MLQPFDHRLAFGGQPGDDQRRSRSQIRRFDPGARQIARSPDDGDPAVDGDVGSHPPQLVDVLKRLE